MKILRNINEFEPYHIDIGLNGIMGLFFMVIWLDGLTILARYIKLINEFHL